MLLCRARSGIMRTPLPKHADFAIVGGGVVGTTIALALRRRHPGAHIVVLEKEAAIGLHASGRNSGVIHAGFYYTADSLKARLTRDGNARLSAFCEAHGVPIRRCGKLVVAQREAERDGLAVLAQRAEANGVEVALVGEDEARRIEPRARTVGRALWSPTTAVVDPRRVMQSIAEALAREKVVVATSTRWLGARGNRIHTDRGALSAGYVINAAGLHADRVARAHGFAEQLCILPFRGAYLHARAGAPPLSVHVYPVPDLAMPFLGVHFTVTIDGGMKIGPTALLAPWRESYAVDRDALRRFSLREAAETAGAGARLLAGSAAFRRHALGELSKLRRAALIRQARRLVRDLDPASFDRWGTPGIRAQLYDLRHNALVMDFLLQGDDRSMHILNAVSPAFTCCFAFADHVLDAIATATGSGCRPC